MEGEAIDAGYGVRAGSGSPLRHRKFDRHYGSDFDQPAWSQRGRGLRGGRGRGRFRDSSPPYGRGRSSGRSYTRSFDEPGFGRPPSRGEGMNRNNPNVSPREGDWICPDPTCGNLNFARRDYCNNCNRLRFGPGGSPRRHSPGPVPHAPAPRFSGPPRNRSPARGMNGYRSPPRDWGRDRPRVFGADPPNLRHGGRFPDHQMRRERLDIREEEDYRARDKFDGPMRSEWGPRGRGRGLFHERRGYEGRNDRHPLSPPSHRGRWGRDLRERSRSPVRVGPPSRDFRRDAFMDRGPDDRRGMVRDRMDELY
ncbi:transcription initiation factor TFIID subunit 15-like isoform X2 [Telopea speciosissima]|uniref:transcription initiation factor TFIID subunit 15-like isoform X2 n=1 Tax=Telopea speciosissima TaxID=54955 RepID=UPI001CC479C0|nr:transcription initiation factor TFIID subunit 15-like isoform X2 [Telopea speciosissima]